MKGNVEIFKITATNNVRVEVIPSVCERNDGVYKKVLTKSSSRKVTLPTFGMNFNVTLPRV